MADPASTRDAIEGAEAAWADGRTADAASLFRRAVASARGAGDVENWTRAVLGLAATQRFGPDSGPLPALLAEALSAQTGTAGRVRLSAALARSWVYAGSPARAVSPADRALELARESTDPGLLADALDAVLTSHWGPDELARRAEFAAELDDVAAHLVDPDARLRAHLWGFTVAFEKLDVLALNRQLSALELLGEDSAKARFFASSRRLALDLMRGRLDTAPAVLDEVVEAADRAMLPDGPVAVLALRSYVSLHAGDEVACADAAARAEELADADGLITVAAEAAPFWVAAGHPERARELLFRFDGPALDAVPRDMDWLLVMQCLLESAVAVHDDTLVARIVPLLARYPARPVVNAGGFLFHGLTDDPLSRAYQLLGEPEPAARLRASALAGYERAGARWWHDRLADSPGRGVRPTSEAAQGRRAGQAPRTAVVLRPRGGGWEVGDPERPSLLPALRGLEHLQRLVARPGASIAALDLVGAPSGGRVVSEPGLGPVLDETAARAYRNRLAELDGELAEAADWADAGRLAVLEAEKEALLSELASAFGLAGRPREHRSSAERARVAVRKAVSAALVRLEIVDPVVAAHLRAHVRTGRFCVYQPEPGQAWTWIVG